MGSAALRNVVRLSGRILFAQSPCLSATCIAEPGSQLGSSCAIRCTTGMRIFSDKASGKMSNDTSTGSQGEASSSGRSDSSRPGAAAGGESGDAGTGSGADSDGNSKSAAAEAAERARIQGQQALDKMAEAARQAASFASGVAGEMLKGSPLGGGSRARGDSSSSDGAAGASGASSSSGSGPGAGSSEGGSTSSPFSRARGFFKAPPSLSRVAEVIRSEVAAAVMPSTNLPSVMRKIVIEDGVELRPGDGPSQLITVKQEQTYWQKMQEIFGNSPFYKTISSKLGSSTAAKKVQEFSADVRERIETADSDVVNRMADMRANMLAENEQAVTYREIKTRNPGFDMPTFLQAIRNDIPIVIKAYLEGNEATLKDYCSDSMVERLMGIYQAGKLHGQIHDPTVLEYSDVDLVDMKMVDNSAVLVLHFNCQQINCYRDNYGNVVSGAPDEVNRMYYYWAVQQDGHGVVTRDGKHIAPRWVLVEMLLRGQIQLL